MPFPVPPITTLVIPTGATSGERIVLDGTTGIITGYAADDTIAFQLAPGPGVTFTSGPPGAGRVQLTDSELIFVLYDALLAATIGIGFALAGMLNPAAANRQPYLQIEPPHFIHAGDSIPAITMYGVAHDGTVESHIDIGADHVIVGADFTIGSTSPVAGIDFGTKNFTSDAASTVTISHDLGGVPGSVLVTGLSNATRIYKAFNYTSTTFDVLMRDNAGALLPLTTDTINWLAIR